MNRAYKLACQAYDNGDVPVGAVIYCHEKQQIIAESYNTVEKENNSLHHAEIIAIDKACEYQQSKLLPSCDLFVTLEPCIMCAAAISYARLKRLYYSAPNKKFGAVESHLRYFTESSCNHRPETYPMSGGDEYMRLLQSFFDDIRA